MIKPARQGSKLAAKGAYIDVSDRKLHVQLTQEAKIASASSFIRAIFAFAGFVSALMRRPFWTPPSYQGTLLQYRHKQPAFQERGLIDVFLLIALEILDDRPQPPPARRLRGRRRPSREYVAFPLRRAVERGCRVVSRQVLIA